MDTNHVATHSLNYSSHMSPYSGTLLPAQPTTAIADTGSLVIFYKLTTMPNIPSLPLPALSSKCRITLASKRPTQVK
jgi:hypothetical protein